MIKWIGALLVMAACTGIGFLKAKNYRNRPRQIQALIQAMRLLQAEIEYSVTPLPQAFKQVADRSTSPSDVLFATAANQLQDADVSVLMAIRSGIDRVTSNSALLAIDYHALEEFAKVVGTTDRMHLANQFQAAFVQLDGLWHEAQDARHRNERLWQYLGVLSGILLVILLY